MKRSYLASTLSLALLAASFSASAFNVTPLSAVHPMEHRGGVLTITNSDDEEKTVQIMVDSLTLENGEQVRNKATDIRVVPSVVTIAPNSKQTVRYLRTNSDTSKEYAYRVSVKEIPSNIVPETSTIRYLFEYDFSWIWRGENMEPELSATWVQDGSGWDLSVSNTGSATAQIVSIDAGSAKREGLIGYVLPGETQIVDMDASSKVGDVSIKANNDVFNLKVD